MRITTRPTYKKISQVQVEIESSIESNQRKAKLNFFEIKIGVQCYYVSFGMKQSRMLIG